MLSVAVQCSHLLTQTVKPGFNAVSPQGLEIGQRQCIFIVYIKHRKGVIVQVMIN